MPHTRRSIQTRWASKSSISRFAFMRTIVNQSIWLAVSQPRSLQALNRKFWTLYTSQPKFHRSVNINPDSPIHFLMLWDRISGNTCLPPNISSIFLMFILIHYWPDARGMQQQLRTSNSERPCIGLEVTGCLPRRKVPSCHAGQIHLTSNWAASCQWDVKALADLSAPIDARK